MQSAAQLSIIDHWSRVDLELVLRHNVLVDELIGVLVHDDLLSANLLVHDRLRKHRLVDLVMSITSIAHLSHAHAQPVLAGWRSTHLTTTSLWQTCVTSRTVYSDAVSQIIFIYYVTLHRDVNCKRAWKIKGIKRL